MIPAVSTNTVAGVMMAIEQGPITRGMQVIDIRGPRL